MLVLNKLYFLEWGGGVGVGETSNFSRTVYRQWVLLLPTQEVKRLPLTCHPKSDKCQTKFNYRSDTGHKRVLRIHECNGQLSLPYRKCLLGNNHDRSPNMISFIQMPDPIVFLLVSRVRHTAVVASLPARQLSQKPCSSLIVSTDTTL